MATSVTPIGTRYVPFSQQPYCCVPTCLQVVLYKNSLPLQPQEEIGAQLGLVVPPEEEKCFWNVAISKEIPMAGYGTRIQEPEYGLEHFLTKNRLPFTGEFQLSSSLKSPQALRHRLAKLQADDADVLICFRSGMVYGNGHTNGHVCVFDILEENTVRLIDPIPNFPKWRSVEIEKLFEAIKLHEDKRMGGLWILKRQK
ncbi:MAG TPA: hypothetical protein VHD60_02940 [Candidatus Saccharimonadales bacterium]|nr:hypothetical protein [Candidatus Saccharimonadales bacterium]